MFFGESGLGAGEVVASLRYDSPVVPDADGGLVHDITAGSTNAQAEILVLLVEEEPLVETAHTVERLSLDEADRSGDPAHPSPSTRAAPRAAQLAVIPGVGAPARPYQLRPDHLRSLPGRERLVEAADSPILEERHVGVEDQDQPRGCSLRQEVVSSAEAEIPGRTLERALQEQRGKEPVEVAEIVARAVVEHVQLPGEAGPREIH